MSDSGEPPKSPSNKDIMNFLAKFKDSMHTEITEAVSKEVAAKVRDGVAETVRTELVTTLRTEIGAAVAPLKDAQKEIVDEIETTKRQVSEMALDHADTKSKIIELQQQMISMQKKISQTSVPANPTSSFLHNLPPKHVLAPPPTLAAAGASRGPPPSTATQTALEVLKNAKRVLGFSPITAEDISYLKEQHATNDDTKVMLLSIKEFLRCEMKVPTTVLDTINIVRVFPPAKSPTGWKTLYAEFEDSTTTDLINQYVRNLRPGITVSIYVPHCLFPRFAAIRDIEHSYRNGDTKHKTRIKYGTSDFVLLIKPRDTNNSWSYVSLTSLPPLQLSMFDGNLSSSPPPGRTRLPSKRARSGSPEGDLTRNNKAKISEVVIDDKEEETAHPTSSESTSTSASSPTRSSADCSPPLSCSAPPGKSDLGSFHPSACVSPRSVSNKSFTFSNKASSIPVMKSSLNC